MSTPQDSSLPTIINCVLLINLHVYLYFTVACPPDNRYPTDNRWTRVQLQFFPIVMIVLVGMNLSFRVLPPFLFCSATILIPCSAFLIPMFCHHSMFSYSHSLFCLSHTPSRKAHFHSHSPVQHACPQEDLNP
jgi:hypothetical protein